MCEEDIAAVGTRSLRLRFGTHRLGRIRICEEDTAAVGTRSLRFKLRTWRFGMHRRGIWRHNICERWKVFAIRLPVSRETSNSN